MIAQALLLTLAVIAVTQIASYALWGGMDGGYDPSIVVAGIMIPAFTCFPISFILLRQRNRMTDLFARLEVAHDELKQRASRDAMTGLLHRQAFFERLNSALGDGAILVIDVDHFKSVNDTYGHAAGDQALRSIATTLERTAGDSAIVARFGGEEFCVFLPLADEFEGLKLGEQMRRQVGAIEFSPNGDRRRLTISAGVARYRPGESVELAISAADAALYEAKRTGRNRVVCSSAEVRIEPARDVA